jgi:tRNA-specific 2-thiouridylase
MFPVGDRGKDAVRDYARELKLPVADKPDSQEICFIPDDDYASFVTARAPHMAAGGVIVDEAGRVVGSHEGIHRFTVGQRKGLGLSSPSPRYVLKLRPAEQQVVVGPKSSLERTTLTASGVNWILGEPEAPLRVTAQIRHRHHAAPAVARASGDGRAELIFDSPQVAITPGQPVVFYDGETVVGGGWID